MQSLVGNQEAQHGFEQSRHEEAKSLPSVGFDISAPEAPTVPSSEGGVPFNPSQHRYAIRRPPTSPPPESSARRTPAKRAKTLSPGESSRHSQPDPWAPRDSQRPSGISPEAIIKRPMVTAPPIEGNLDYRARPFHSKLYFDFESMTTQGARSPTTVHFNINGRQGILETRHVAEAPHIPYELVDPTHFRDGPLYLSGTWSTSYPGGPLEIQSFYARKEQWRRGKQGKENRDTAAVFLRPFGALPEVHFLHAIYHCKAHEVKNPTLQPVYNLELK
ncbi:hypothetical protein CK203_058646 [Vitis vinifera]|uniref:Uncharacterized protein n=1 Tax=Vitis vinifera TaxID=29760 RepID=A0A438FTM2_VITVI|nr:hypothetical protein CK203_058646 [Vitis vinifera]